MVDRVVQDWQRAVAAFVVDLEAVVDHVFFADLYVVGDFFAIQGLAPAAFVQRILRINQVTVILEQPVDSAVGAAALFVGGEGHDDVAIGFKTFLFVADQVGDPDGGLGFVVAGAAAVEVAVFLDELERVHIPVFALGLDDVGVGEEQDGFVGAGAVIADDQVALLGNCAAYENVGVGETCGFESCGGGFGYRRGCAGGVPRLDLDELFVDVAGQLFFGFGPGGLAAKDYRAKR